MKGSGLKLWAFFIVTELQNHFLKNYIKLKSIHADKIKENIASI
jgi:hypothetical protein